MSKTFVPEGYTPLLNSFDTQTAISDIKNIFVNNLCSALNLQRVSAPLFVNPDTGLNDDLNGIERPVNFDIPEIGINAQVIHSLAKWKRMALYKYDFETGRGLYTDMNAIRRDEQLDNLHSLYVDQWDWEKIISPETRNIDYLKETAQKIVDAVCDTLDEIKKKYPLIKTVLERKINFITAQELENIYPSLSPKEREYEYLKENKTAFIMKIGDLLNSGEKHDGRAPDYDDWNLNGDILFWNEKIKNVFEVSSMGIRVDSKSLYEQLKKSNCEDRKNLPFHKMILENKLPLTMGGGIGQSRLCMLLLEKAHIGEVQVSLWDKDTINICKSNGIKLL